MNPNIAFIGKAGAGKDTAAELLIESLSYYRLAFADKLKDVAAALWGDEARTDRDKLQRLGEYVRQIDPDTWVNCALARHKTDLPCAVTDCRYRNEAWRLKGEDFIVVRVMCDRNERINRLRTNGKLGPAGWEQHISETDLDDWPADYQVWNGAGTTKVNLLEQLTSVIKQEGQYANSTSN